LRTLIDDGDLRRSLATGAREAAMRLPPWADSSAAFSDLLTRLT
jgi:hypothetical protein